MVGGGPGFCVADFRFICILNTYERSFSDLELLRRALIVPDAATAAGSLPRLCVDRACPALILFRFTGGCVLEYIFRVWSGFRQIARAIGM